MYQKIKSILEFTDFKNHLYIKWKGTYIGYNVPKNAYNLTELFLREVIQIRKKYNYELSNIINC